MPPLVRRTSSFTAKDARDTYASVPEQSHDQKVIPDIDMKELMSGLLGGPPPSDADEPELDQPLPAHPPLHEPAALQPPPPMQPPQPAAAVKVEPRSFLLAAPAFHAPSLAVRSSAQPSKAMAPVPLVAPPPPPLPLPPVQLPPVAAAMVDSRDGVECVEVDADRSDSLPLQCWGGVLKGTPATCTPGFVSGKAHFKNKFCLACREGIAVPASRVRALAPEMHAWYNNSLRAGFWKVRPPPPSPMSSHLLSRLLSHLLSPSLTFSRTGSRQVASSAIGGGEVRIANNTITCDGPWLVVYRGAPVKHAAR